MNNYTNTKLVAYAGKVKIGFGDINELAPLIKKFQDNNSEQSVLIFNGQNSKPIDLDLRGNEQSIINQLPVEPIKENEAELPAAPKGRGRPKLGVVPREITLLPRHWEWLASQSGGASVTLRKLVEKARKESADIDKRKAAVNSVYAFMSAMAGDEANFEEATRALYAGDFAKANNLVSDWPKDLASHTSYLLSLCE